MLTLLFALALCLPQSPSASPTRLVLETFPDGKPQREYEVADVKGTTQKHGSFREWHANGALKCEGKFEKDLESGAWSFFGESGQPLASGRFAKGERVGAWTEHWPSGAKKLEGKYAKGRREGRWKAWNADGSVDAAGTGVWSFQSSTWPDGTPREEGYTCNGVRHGEWTARAPSGAPDWHGEFRAGLRHGSWTFHRADGTLHSEGHYVDGVAEGAWTSFWEDGKAQVSGSYSAGKRSGSWQLLHPDGRVATALVTGAYAAGTRSKPATNADAKAESPEDLAAYPKAASAFESNAVLATRIAEFVEQASGNDAAAQAAAFQWLAYYGRAALPVVLEKFVRVDLTKAPGATLAERFDAEYFRRAFVGASFPLPRGITPAANAGRFEWLRSWYSLWALTHDDLAYWAIDLRGEPRTNDTEAARAALLAAPPIFEPDRALALHERTPIARYALRFAPRDGATPELLASVREGLTWLAAHQDIRGWWDTANFADSCGRIGKSVCDGTVLRSRYVGVTGLALLAFLADGNTPEHGPFASTVARAVGVLLELQDGKTGMFFADWAERDAAGVERRYIPSDFVYDHAIATLALSEALAVSEHSALRKRLSRAVAASIGAHNPYAGWGYSATADGSGDTSITAWMALALDAARRAGLAVDESVFRDAAAFCDGLTDPQVGRTGYNSPGSIGARVPEVNDTYPQSCETLTGCGLVCRELAGAAFDDSPVARLGAELLLHALPHADPLGLTIDPYGWQWCTLALREIDDTRYWRPWRTALEETLLGSQRRDGDTRGSWDGFGPWAYAYGRIGSTALCVLSLQATWRYAPAQRAADRPKR